MKERRIGILGAGNMGCAILRGLLAGGQVKPESLWVSDVDLQRLSQLEQELRITTTSSNQELVKSADVVVLAVKPQMLTAVLGGIGGAWQDGTLVVSILAGVSTAALEAKLPQSTRVIRAMPNTPALVLEAATAITPGSRATASDVESARALFDCVGRTVEVTESMMDAVTGLSGSGPAFILLVVEAMADGAVRMGMPRALALQLAAQTVAGTARLLLQTGEHPAVLKDRVTSPAGTTIAGLMELEAAGVRHAFAQAVVSAATRASELGSPRGTRNGIESKIPETERTEERQ
jgi:pyrroline-5-carboxylate reductase